MGSLANPQSGPMIGPYRLIRRLGVGGMAETFEAVKTGPGGFEQRVCLKRVLPVLQKEERFVKMFLKEAKTAAGLRHKNIVQVLDFGEFEGTHFLTLELIDGMDLRQVLSGLGRRGERMTSGLVSHLAFELGAALAYAHQATDEGAIRGVVHRDISPSNVLISREGEIKLADFGIAKAMNVTKISESGVIKGKVPYMAPEYALGGRYDARTDIFALGVTLYECLTGRRPYQGKRDLETLRQIQEGSFLPLKKALPTTPDELALVVDRCLNKEPNERFPTLHALTDALVDAAPPPTAPRIWAELISRLSAEEAENDLSTAKTAVADETTPDAPWSDSPGVSNVQPGSVSAANIATRTAPVQPRAVLSGPADAATSGSSWDSIPQAPSAPASELHTTPRPSSLRPAADPLGHLNEPSTVSVVRQVSGLGKRSRLPWVALALVFLALIAIGAVFLTQL